MTTGYPKLPNGPSAKGAAEVRNLRSQGGEFQVTRRVGVESRLSDDFSRVKTRPGGYITHGYLKDGDKQKTYSATTYEPPCVAMIPWIPVKREIINPAPVESGFYAAAFTVGDYEQTDYEELTYTLTKPAMGGGTVTVNRTVPCWTIRRKAVIARVNYWGKIGSGVEVSIGTTMADYLGRPAFPVFSPWLAYAGKATVATADEPMATLFCACPTLSSRVDQQGRKRNDISFNVLPYKADAYTIPINPASFAHADAEFAQMMPAIATENHAAVFLREKPYWVNFVDVSDPPDATRKLWMLRVSGKDFGSISAYDLTPTLCDGQIDRATTLTDGSIFTPPDLINSYIDELMAFHMRLCALPNNVVLVSYFVGLVDDLPLPRPPGDLTVNGYQYQIRIARIDLTSGAMAEVTYEEPAKSPFVFNPATTAYIVPFYPGALVTGMTHIGEGRVIAKIAEGLQPVKRAWEEVDQPFLIKEPGTESIRFIMSNNSGLTWFPITPSGFDGAMELGKMGDITVHRPRVDDKPATMIVNAWSASVGAYYSYVSKDDGLTWKRAGKIAKPDDFQRMDGVWRDVGGFGMDSWGGDATFKNLLPPTGQRFPDMTIPNRFEVQE